MVVWPMPDEPPLSALGHQPSAEALPAESRAPRAESPPSDRRRALAGAAFLMATSAIGPGFLTQTAAFTERLGASLGFAILASVLFDLGAQLTVWRVIAAARRPAQDVANAVMPGLGHLLVVLVAA